MRWPPPPSSSLWEKIELYYTTPPAMVQISRCSLACFREGRYWCGTRTINSKVFINWVNPMPFFRSFMRLMTTSSPDLSWMDLAAIDRLTLSELIKLIHGWSQWKSYGAGGTNVSKWGQCSIHATTPICGEPRNQRRQMHWTIWGEIWGFLVWRMTSRRESWWDKNNFNGSVIRVSGYS